MLLDATGVHLVPLDRRSGQRGDILLLHPNTYFLMPQRLSLYHWTDAMAKEATYFYFTSKLTLTPFDVTGSQLMPLDRRHGRRGDILLLHALPAALVQQALGRCPSLHSPSHDVG